jgi:hypothetical protein
LSEKEKICLDARLNEGINYFEVREEASRILQKMNPRFPELIYVTRTINGKVMRILTKMILEPEAIDIKEF